MTSKPQGRAPCVLFPALPAGATKAERKQHPADCQAAVRSAFLQAASMPAARLAGLYVRHVCGCRRCPEPSHLVLRPPGFSAEGQAGGWAGAAEITAADYGALRAAFRAGEAAPREVQLRCRITPRALERLYWEALEDGSPS